MRTFSPIEPNLSPTPSSSGLSRGSPRNAFSLVELSIVLVILGLLTGGILAGQSLIRAAELRSVTTEYQRWVTATRTFQDKYMALPGDMPNATRFWGRADGGTDLTQNCATPASDSGAGTCNGNGNGRIAGTTNNERFRYWQQLALAGLIEGSYTGVAGSGGTQHHVPGQNCPKSSLSNAGWAFDSGFGSYAGNGSLWTFSAEEAPQHEFKMGGATTNNEVFGRIFTPEEVWNIDVKLDDGKPGLGKVWLFYWAECSTATANTQKATADYKLTEKGRLCSIYFPRAF